MFEWDPHIHRSSGAFPNHENTSYGPNSFRVILFSSPEEMQWTLYVRCDTKESHIQGATVDGAQRSWKTTTFKLHPHITYCVSLHPHSFQDYHPHPYWSSYPGCHHEWMFNVFPYVALNVMWHPKSEGKKRPWRMWLTIGRKKQLRHYLEMKQMYCTCLISSTTELHFYHEVDDYRDPSVGLQYDSFPEHSAQMWETGRSNA